MAESTFGRRAVNDGKLVSRLRLGARITPETLTRLNDYLRAQGAATAVPARPIAQDPCSLTLYPCALSPAGAPERTTSPLTASQTGNRRIEMLR